MRDYFERHHASAHVAAVAGVLVATLSDYLKNGSSSAMDKIANGIFAFTGFNFGLALALLILIGWACCWVSEPRTRVDGFTRGLSALSVLAIVSPQPGFEPLDKTTRPASVTRPASAQMSMTTAYPAMLTAQGTTGRVVVKLWAANGLEQPFEALVTLREAGSGSIVARQRVQTAEFEVAQSRGRYVVEVESDGYRRTRTPIDVGLAPVTYEIELEHSSMPVGVQRFYPADEVLPSLADGPTPTQ